MKLIGIDRQLSFDGDTAVVRREQEITDEFLADLADSRIESARRSAPLGEMVRVASIPIGVVEKWYSEGFNIYDPNVTAKEILARLHAEELTAFLATERNMI